MDKKVLDAIIELVSEETPAVLATIIKVTGSVPRHEGAKMLVFPEGRVVGTIGGGCGEAEVRREALIVLDTNQPRSYSVYLNSDLAADEGMVCGGIMEVFLEPVGEKLIFQKARECLEASRPAVLVTALEQRARKALYDVNGKLLAGEEQPGITADKLKTVFAAGRASSEDFPGLGRVLLEPVLPVEKLLILGAGHVAQPVALMGKWLDFHVTVIDDRPDFANQVRYPGVDEVICADFVSAIRQYGIDPNTYIVIVTRGHQYDEACLREVLGSSAKYLGMIGSRRRVKLLLNKLKEEGFPAEDLDKVKSPIGLNIGAETPAEIAVSILAEIIAVRRGRDSCQPPAVSCQPKQ
ncbi:XdhC family protein [Zhaonella formicivorans]|uniref:XdhC family protein n=1 Tax=Zhaonella formicivorans TaxID=2528593 RepID=UPI0010EDDB3D|nr:XdhC/CoxI family protein [Zhaonella formicivorans]